MLLYLETNTDEEEKEKKDCICYPCSSTILTTTLQLVCGSNEVDSTSDHFQKMTWLVLFCNAHPMKTESSDEENNGDMDEETIPSEEL